jgi:adenosylhomocysteine nucleosidase
MTSTDFVKALVWYACLAENPIKDKPKMTQDKKSPQEKNEPEVVVIISANAEWRAMRRLFPAAVILASPYGEWFRAKPAAQGAEPAPDVIFFHGGWGKIAAAASAQYVIDRWSPRLLVNFGTCGGFEGRIEPGTIILVEKTIVYDIIEQMGDFMAGINHYTTNIDLSWLRKPYPQNVLRSLLVSGDRDLLAEDVPLLAERYGAVAGDWESGAIAYVAHRNGVRLLILRGVTDLVGGQGSEAYGNLALFEEAAYKILENLVRALPAWIRAGSTP